MRMRYFVRAVKYFITICLLTALILTVLAMLGLVSKDIHVMFRDGWKSVGYTALMFAAVSALYPKFKYTRRQVCLTGETAGIRPLVEAEMQRRGFMLEEASEEKITFRKASFSARLGRFFEDRVTFERIVNGYDVEGLTRDVVLIANALAYSARERDGEAPKE